MREPEAVKKAMEHVETFLDDEHQRVFQVLGYYGIGKRTALRKLFNFPDLPGVHIRLKKEEILNLVGRKMKEDGADDLRLKLMMRNINSSDIVE